MSIIAYNLKIAARIAARKIAVAKNRAMFEIIADNIDYYNVMINGKH